MNHRSLAVTLLLTTLCTQAGIVRYTYCDPEVETGWTGTMKAERYDVAIAIDDPALRGARIVGLEVPASPSAAVGNYSGWLTRELKLESKVNIPDITSAEGSVTTGLVNVTFAEPYTVGEETVYAGYSFDVSEVQAGNDMDMAKYPVAVQAGVVPGAMWIHTKRHYLQWGDRGESLGATSMITVLLDGDFSEVSAAISPAEAVKAQYDVDKISIPVVLRSYGSQPLSSLHFDVKVDGTAVPAATVTLTEPLQTAFAHPYTIYVDLPNNYAMGHHDIELTLTQINGVENPNQYRTALADVTLVKLFPTKKPVVEEYTGLWCGFCPRGYVALEDMTADEPDFIGVAFHNKDAMTVTNTYPSYVSGFPAYAIDRSGSTRTPYPKAVRQAWNERRRLYTPVAVSVDASLSDNDPRQITANATLTFVEQPAHTCRIEYLLLANGLTHPDWGQHNYFRGNPEEGLDFFVTALPVVFGLEFNDVVAMYTPYAGEVGSLPEAAEVVPYEEIHHSHIFDTNGHTAGWVEEGAQPKEYDIIGMARTYSVVALVIDTTTGEILNAAQTDINNPASVASPGNDSETVATEYYDLTGRRIDNPSGMCLRIDTKSDGTRTTTKIMAR